MDYLVPAKVAYDSDLMRIEKRVSVFLEMEYAEECGKDGTHRFYNICALVVSKEVGGVRIPFRTKLPAHSHRIPANIRVQIRTGDIDEVSFIFWHEGQLFEAHTTFGPLSGLIADVEPETEEDCEPESDEDGQGLLDLIPSRETV